MACCEGVLSRLVRQAAAFRVTKAKLYFTSRVPSTADMRMITALGWARKSWAVMLWALHIEPCRGAGNENIRLQELLSNGCLVYAEPQSRGGNTESLPHYESSFDLMKSTSTTYMIMEWRRQATAAGLYFSELSASAY